MDRRALPDFAWKDHSPHGSNLQAFVGTTLCRGLWEGDLQTEKLAHLVLVLKSHLRMP